MNISRFFIDRPIFAGVLSILIFVAGGIAMFQLPISQYPEVVPPSVQVRAQYPGANPKVIAETVALHTIFDLVRACLRNQPPPEPALINTCYSLLAPDYGISIAGVYQVADDEIVAMINLDMVGRLRDGRVTVFGTRSTEEFSGIVKSAAMELGLEISESDGIGRSDHMSFYGKKIPALHFFTGIHPDYHGPGDTWDKLNLEGMAKITELVARGLGKRTIARRHII